MNNSCFILICLIHARKGNLDNIVNANFAGIYHSINNDWLKCKRMRDWSWVFDDGIETTNFFRPLIYRYI